MHITEIIAVSPVNPAHGRHEVHARTAECIDVGFQISPEALGCLTGHFSTLEHLDILYQEYIDAQEEPSSKAPLKEGS